MFNHHPDQRPFFLFGLPTEQENIRYETYLTLQADREALEVQLKAAEATLQTLMSELQSAGIERENLRALAENGKHLSDQSKASFLNVIGALVNTMLSSSEAGRRHSIFDNQAAIVDSITAHYSGVPGLSKRSLDEKFAAGRRSLSRT
ncbi:protein kinase [Pseudomonas viciae]|uniref:Protein kinase n=2 Tax=Pseudomonas TaxID=286 RepID=A0A4P7PPG8_9PSED|nr:protein kinase [Pseudomonas viciae]